MIRIYTSLELDRRSAFIARPADAFSKSSRLHDFAFTPEPGMLYVTARAISSRVNANYDGWPSSELEKAYRTFIGTPVFVDHRNWDERRSRGAIIDARLLRDRLASGHEDTWVELLIEVDARAFPKLAEAIMRGDVDAVSMGADVEFTVCSACGNKARDVSEYCRHIPAMKGRKVLIDDKTSGRKQSVMVYEDCYGVHFFEISFVFDPADESALITDTFLAPARAASRRTIRHLRARGEPVERYRRRVAGISKAAAAAAMRRTSDEMLLALPEDVDTLREDPVCPVCGSIWDGLRCPTCGFEQPPPGLRAPASEPGVGIDESLMGAPLESGPGEGQGEEGPEGQEEQGEEEQGEEGEEEHEHSDEDGDGVCDVCGEEMDDQEDDEEDEGGKMAKTRIDEIRARQDQTKTADGGSPFSTHDVGTAYTQETSPENTVTPYGTAGPAGAPTPPPEPPFTTTDVERMPAALENVQDLDSSVVQGPVGQSAVSIAAPEAPVTAASQERARLLARAKMFERQAERLRRRAEMVIPDDVQNLDLPAPVDVQPDAVADVTSPTAEPNQLALADTPDIINDGRETGIGLPVERVPGSGQVNPFNDAALVPYMPPNPAVMPAGAPVEASREEIEKEIRQARREEAARILRISNLVDTRIDLGLTNPDRKLAEMARFEQMGDQEIEGFIRATEEIREKRVRSAGRRVRVASGSRAPEIGGPAPQAPPIDEQTADSLLFL